MGRPFLTGFEKFRIADGQSFKAGDNLWHKNLYRHPERQGAWPEKEYTTLHDVYSLGVVLLELGIWQSFVVEGTDGTPVPGPVLPISTLLAEKNQRKKAAEIKQVLVDLSRHALPSCMRNKYTSIVLSCLTCLDVENPGFGDPDEFVDEDGILMGVKHVEEVSHRRLTGNPALTS